MPKRLLVALDETDAAARAVPFAIGLARREGASLYVMYVNQYLVGGRGHTVLTPAEADALVSQAVEEAVACGVEAVGFVRRATCFNVSRVIADSALATHSEAIVVGTRRARGWARRFGHGIRERLAHQSPVPVLVAPGPLDVPSALPAEAVRWAPPQVRS
ncbi:MAG: universal stress protein [Acidimicrobiaceae bacterium]|nr:universal stress protein [Acidimicrobiaceae bacterium]